MNARQASGPRERPCGSRRHHFEFESEDFGAEFTPELREQEERLRARISRPPKR
jgi:hypothetical protein